MIEVFTVKFLIEAAASGAIGHWVGKAIEGVSAQVAKMIAEGKTPEEIAELIEEKNLGAEFDKLSSGILEKSIFYSDDIDIAKRPEDKVELISSILRFISEISRKEKLDVLLRGSPLGSLGFTIFRYGARIDSDKYKPDGVQLHLPERGSGEVKNFKSGVYIIPLYTEEMRNKIYNEYIEYIKFAHGYSNDEKLYLDILNKDLFDGKISRYEVKIITAVTVNFYRGLPSTIDYVKLLGDKFLGKEVVGQSDWEVGLSEMLKSVVELRDARYLKSEDWDKILEVSKLLEILK